MPETNLPPKIIVTKIVKLDSQRVVLYGVWQTGPWPWEPLWHRARTNCCTANGNHRLKTGAAGTGFNQLLRGGGLECQAVAKNGPFLGFGALLVPEGLGPAFFQA